MLQHTAPGEYEWRQLHERLDRAIAEAASLYVHGLASRHLPMDASKCTHEIYELRMGREPDYAMPGVPLFYALRYMARRVTALFGAVLSVLGDWYPTSVLDVGSGTGATALALDLLNLPRHIDLVGIEPSQEMIDFADCSRYRQRVSAHYQQGSMEDLMTGNTSLDPFDLLVFSACLPYDFEDWIRLSAAIGNYEGHQHVTLLVAEPESKLEFLASFQRQLESKGWPTITFCCHDLPEVIKNNSLPLRAMLNVWRRLGLDDSILPRTWWYPPDDKFLVANPVPARPLPSGVGPGFGSHFLAPSPQRATGSLAK